MTRRRCGSGRPRNHPRVPTASPLGLTDTSCSPRPRTNPSLPADLLHCSLPSPPRRGPETAEATCLAAPSGLVLSSRAQDSRCLSPQRVPRVRLPVASIVTLLIRRAVAFRPQAAGPLTILHAVPVPHSTQGGSVKSHIRPCACHWMAGQLTPVPAHVLGGRGLYPPSPPLPSVCPATARHGSPVPSSPVRSRVARSAAPRALLWLPPGRPLTCCRSAGMCHLS